MHGGRRFAAPELVDAGLERAIEELAVLAPLHNRRALEGIRRAREALPDVPHVAVFDTAFHRTMPEAASTYAIPEHWRDEWEVHRYGFHGINVQWVASQVRVPRLVVCHLGGGCSVTAVRDGRSADTTMGFSPLEGVPMATRSGSVDPAALVYLLREGKLDAEELERQLEHESGLAGTLGRRLGRRPRGVAARARGLRAPRLGSRRRDGGGVRRAWTRSPSPAGSASTPRTCGSGSSSACASSATSASRSCRHARSS